MVPVLMLFLIVAAIAVAVVGLVFWTRRSHDDEHSVEGYHRQLHTLEVLRTHTEGQSEEAKAAAPSSAFRVTPTPTVRLTEPGKPIVPPVPPPPVANPDKPITFDDAGTVVSTPTSSGSGLPWADDKAMHGIDHRPRRLAAPAAAVGGVLVLIVILVVTGFHNSPPPHHHGTSTTLSQTKSTATTKAPAATHHHRTGRRSSTATTVPPFVSLPTATSAHGANYTVQQASYTLAMSATSSSCWVDATNASGAVLFTGVISSGQTKTVTADGPVSIVIGAPDFFTANVNGTEVSFPFGFIAPFTMHLIPVAAGATP